MLATLGIVLGLGATILTVYRPRIQSWRRRRRERRDQQRALDDLQQTGALLKLKLLVDGEPPTIDAVGNVEDEGHPSLVAWMRTIDKRTIQLTENSGSHLADKVIAAAESLGDLHVKFDGLQARTDERHDEYVRRLDALDATTEANGDALERARALAAEAATTAKHTADGYTRLEDVVRELWRLIVERVEHAEMRVATYAAALQELGIDVEMPPHPPPRTPPTD